MQTPKTYATYDVAKVNDLLDALDTHLQPLLALRNAYANALYFSERSSTPAYRVYALRASATKAVKALEAITACFTFEEDGGDAT